MFKRVFLVCCLSLSTLGQVLLPTVDDGFQRGSRVPRAPAGGSWVSPWGFSSPEIHFPPPQPNKNNIGNICQLQRFRPVYDPVTMPSDPTGHHREMARTINQLEVAYTKCCAGTDKVACAVRLWSGLLTQFCLEPTEKLGASTPCCLKTFVDRDTCFASRATFPNYDREVHFLNLAAVSVRELDILCRSPIEVANDGLTKILATGLRKNCCKGQTAAKAEKCAAVERAKLVNQACKQHAKEWTDTQGCCKTSRASCFNTKYLAKVKVIAKTPNDVKLKF